MPVEIPQEILTELGFKDAEEFQDLMSKVIITSTRDYIAFEMWKRGDGSKKGLLKFIGESEKL